MQRAAITFTLTVDLDRVPGWGDKPSDWVDVVQQRVCSSDTYKPEIETHEILLKNYTWDDATGYVRPEFVTAANREVIVRGEIDRIIGALSLLQDVDQEQGHSDEARKTRDLIRKLQSSFDLPEQGGRDA